MYNNCYSLARVWAACDWTQFELQFANVALPLGRRY